jgi:hypothetical protein
MPEPPNMVPLFAARVADLRQGHYVVATCGACAHQGEVAVVVLRLRLNASMFVKRLGRTFRCTQCGHRGATIDARRALGHYG